MADGPKWEPGGPLWDPDRANGLHDDRFTEWDPRYIDLFAQAQLAQLSPRALQNMDIEDLIYLSGHHERPADIGDEEWGKLGNNSQRADAERQRRWGDEVAKRARLLAGIAVAISLASFGVTAWNAFVDDDGPSSSPSVVTTTIP